MTLVSPYFDIKQYTKISIEAFHMNNDIVNNIFNLLKKKLEKKCNKNGYIINIYNIVEHSDGIIPPENLNGSAIYNVSYNCKMCIPIENTIIIGIVRIINQELIIGTSGPIMIFIPKDNVNIELWNISDGYIYKNSKVQLEVEHFIKILIIDKRINQNDTQIKALGKLLDIPTKEEISKYYE